MNSLIKVTLNLTESQIKDVEVMALAQDLTKSGIIRQAIKNQKFFFDAKLENQKILLEDSNGKIQRIILF